MSTSGDGTRDRWERRARGVSPALLPRLSEAADRSRSGAVSSQRPSLGNRRRGAVAQNCSVAIRLRGTPQLVSAPTAAWTMRGPPLT